MLLNTSEKAHENGSFPSPTVEDGKSSREAADPLEGKLHNLGVSGKRNLK
jgi:hypothetical protein